MQKDIWRIKQMLQYIPDDFQLYINLQCYLFLLTGLVVFHSEMMSEKSQA